MGFFYSLYPVLPTIERIHYIVKEKENYSQEEVESLESCHAIILTGPKNIEGVVTDIKVIWYTYGFFLNSLK